MKMSVILTRFLMMPWAFLGLCILGVFLISAALWVSIGLSDKHEEFERQQHPDVVAARERAAKQHRDHYWRQIRADIPPQDADPWADLWWQTLTMCRTWYHLTAQQSPGKITRHHPTLQAYQRALHFLRKRYRRECYWYHGSAEMVAGQMVAVLGLLEAGILGGVGYLFFVVPTSHPWGWASPGGVFFPLFGVVGLLSAAALLFHAILLWWVAGPPWWHPDRRVQRILTRMGAQT